MQIIKIWHRRHFGPTQSGIANGLLLVGAMIFLMSTFYIFPTAKNLKANKEKNRNRLNDINNDRYVQQVIADDQLCAKTDFLQGLSGWSVTKLSEPRLLKDNNSLINLGGIGMPNAMWPTNAGEREMASGETPSRQPVTGPGRVDTIVFDQPKDRHVPKTVYPNGDYIYRIPVLVRDKGIIGGAVAYFSGGITTYIELTPNSESNPVACYSPLSSRSLCLDRGGRFDPLAAGQKCKFN